MDGWMDGWMRTSVHGRKPIQMISLVDLYMELSNVQTTGARLRVELVGFLEFRTAAG